MEKLCNTINTVLNLHVHIKQPMTKQSIVCVCKLIEQMKLIKLTIKGYSTEIYNTTLCLSQFQLYQALQLISNVKNNFQSTTNNSLVYNERTVDIMSALELSQSALLGSPNIKRILVARLALTMTDPKQIFQTEQLNKICRLFISTERLIQLSDVLHKLSNGSYIYWHYDAILPIYSRYVINFNEVADCEKIQV